MLGRTINLSDILSNVWLGSGRIVTSVALVILPIIVIVTNIVIRYQISPMITQNPLTIWEDMPFLRTLITTISSFQIIAFIAILLIYPPYPAPYSIKKYFLKRGFSKAVKEYEAVKQVLYVSVPLLIIVTSIMIIHDLRLQTETTYPFPFEELSIFVRPYIDAFYPIRVLLILIVLAGIIKLTLALIRRDFKLYYTRGCFVLLQDARNEAEEMRYFVLGINSYSSYLRRQMSLEINNLKKIYSVIAASREQKDTIMRKLSFLFLSDKKMEQDTLEPLRELSRLLDKPPSEILVDQPLIAKLKGWGAAAAVIIPLIIQLASTFGGFK
jgi:hypothetical protein